MTQFTKPECLDCGNMDSFNIPIKGWEVREYDKDGHMTQILDADIYLYSGELASCTDCDSTNVTGDF